MSIFTTVKKVEDLNNQQDYLKYFKSFIDDYNKVSLKNELTPYCTPKYTGNSYSGPCTAITRKLESYKHPPSKVEDVLKGILKLSDITGSLFRLLTNPLGTYDNVVARSSMRAYSALYIKLLYEAISNNNTGQSGIPDDFDIGVYEQLKNFNNTISENIRGVISTVNNLYKDEWRRVAFVVGLWEIMKCSAIILYYCHLDAKKNSKPQPTTKIGKLEQAATTMANSLWRSTGWGAQSADVKTGLGVKGGNNVTRRRRSRKACTRMRRHRNRYSLIR